MTVVPIVTSDGERCPRAQWDRERAEHWARVQPWVEDRLRRASRREKHPVRDFLFEYYSFRPAHLMRWSPGADVILEDAQPEDTGWTEFACVPGGIVLPKESFPEQRQPYLDWAVHYLTSTGAAEPSFSCFGLHEWAMVYRDPNVRHGQVPLRLSRTEVDAVVESHALRCTHYDAFRFFTPAAVPLNRFALSRSQTAEFDQPGCIHATMDLYRFAYKLGPYVPSSLLADAFELACAARTIDMRASPYDLRAYGYEPICIETREGREEYVAAQRSLTRQAEPIRARLRSVYAFLLAPAKCRTIQPEA